MKYWLLLLSALTLRPELVLSQPDPINIEFVEAQPIWEHLVWDTAFYEIGNQPDINKYTVVVPHQSFRFNDDLFILNACLNYRGEAYGYILERINIRDGEVIWRSYNTFYNGGIQDYYKNLYLRPDGNLEMVGIKRHGPYQDLGFAYWNTGGGQSDYIRKVFDYNSGNPISITIGGDSLQQIIPTNLNHYPIVFDSLYLTVQLSGEQVNDHISFGYSFYILNGNHDLMDPMPISTIYYETNDSLGPFSIGQPPYIEPLDDSTLVGVIFQDRNDPPNAKVQLIWADIGNTAAIAPIRRKNIEELVPIYGSSLLYFQYKVVNNTILLTQPYYMPAIQGYTAYLICLDRSGNVEHSIPFCKIENHYYEAIYPAYISNEYHIFAALPSITGRSGFDLLRLDKDKSTYSYISSLTSAHNDEEFTRQMSVCNLYDDGLFVIGAYTKKTGGEQNSAVKYYGFSANDLGIDLSTSARTTYASDIRIYPNPAKEVITIESSKHVNGRLKLFDLLGREVAGFSIDGYKTQISTQEIPRGGYYLILNNENGVTLALSKIVIAHY